MYPHLNCVSAFRTKSGYRIGSIATGVFTQNCCNMSHPYFQFVILYEFIIPTLIYNNVLFNLYSKAVTKLVETWHNKVSMKITLLFL